MQGSYSLDCIFCARAESVIYILLFTESIYYFRKYNIIEWCTSLIVCSAVNAYISLYYNINRLPRANLYYGPR